MPELLDEILTDCDWPPKGTPGAGKPSRWTHSTAKYWRYNFQQLSPTRAIAPTVTGGQTVETSVQDSDGVHATVHESRSIPLPARWRRGPAPDPRRHQT